jgi:pimeloyl-ACP methyl ester carboxylesterase
MLALTLDATPTTSFRDENQAWIRVHGQGTPCYSRRVLLSNFLRDIEELPEDLVGALDDVSSIDRPVLVICGDRDPVFSVPEAIELSRRTGGALAVLPATGHLVHQEMPGLFNDLVLDHIMRVIGS